jgi:hypothetical protein
MMTECPTFTDAAPAEAAESPLALAEHQTFGSDRQPGVSLVLRCKQGHAPRVTATREAGRAAAIRRRDAARQKARQLPAVLKYRATVDRLAAGEAEAAAAVEHATGVRRTLLKAIRAGGADVPQIERRQAEAHQKSDALAARVPILRQVAEAAKAKALEAVRDFARQEQDAAEAVTLRALRDATAAMEAAACAAALRWVAAAEEHGATLGRNREWDFTGDV